MVERKSRAVSSIGRAFGLHPKGRRFEPCTAHSFCPPRSENRRRNRDLRKRHLCRIADPPSALVFSDPLRVDEREQRGAGCYRVYGKDHAGKVVHAICGARRKPKQNLFNSGTVKGLPFIGAPTEEPACHLLPGIFRQVVVAFHLPSNLRGRPSNTYGSVNSSDRRNA